MKHLRLICATLALAIFAADASSFKGRGLLASVSLQSQASAISDSQHGSASVHSESVAVEGDVKVEAQALSFSLEETRNEFVGIQFRARRRVENGAKLRSVVNSAARAAARATAKTLTTVSIRAESTGEGNEICADSFANATANAKAVAEVFVDVFIKGSPKKFSKKERREQAKSVSAATAEAATSASASACLEGEGSVTAFQEAFASAVTRVYAAVIINAFGEVAEDEEAKKSFSRARSGIEENIEVGGNSRNRAVGRGRAESDADGFASVEEIEECRLRFGICCGRGISDEKSRCTCGFQCTMKPVHFGGSTHGYELVKAPKGHKKGFKCRCDF